MARLLTALAALTAAAAFAPPAAQRAATRLRAEPDARNLDAPRALDRRAAAVGLAAAAATAAAPRAVADQVVSASAIQKTKGGVKYVIVKEGKCPNADPTGLAGSCVPTSGSFLCVNQIFNPDSMCAYATVSAQDFLLCFENSTRAIDSSKNQPNRHRFDGAREF